MRRVGLLLAAVTAVLAVAAPAAMADTQTTIYRSTVQPLPPNLVSQAYQATQMSELGDEITFAHHARRLKTVTVTMSSWGCQTGGWSTGDCLTSPGARFAWPITLNLYAASTTSPSMTPVEPVMPPIASVTKTFNIPYRPSVNPVRCAGGAWYSKRDHACHNGIAANITFNLASLHLKLPNTIVWGVAFDTSNYGPDPVGPAPCDLTTAGCPYDSLNLALAPSVKVGSKPYPNTVFQNTATEGNLCDSGDLTPIALTNVFNLDSPQHACWGGYVPAAKFRATP